MTKEEKRTEALKRMKIAGLWDEAVRAFDDNGIVCYSEPTRMVKGGPVLGIVYELEPDMKKRVRDFEEEYKGLVWHVIRSYTEFGEWLTYLYVSDHEEEWSDDRADLKDGYSVAYVDTGDYCSEFGSVAFKNRAGGLVRTA